MKIAIIGSGNLGSAIASALAAKGHQIVLGTRDVKGTRVLELLKLYPNITADTIDSAAAEGKIIIIAVPLLAVTETVILFKNIGQKVIIETTNAFGKSISGFDNATVAIKQITGSANVARCFNTTGAENILQLQFNDFKIDTFTAGDSSTAKDVAKKLAIDVGFGNCYDLGGDESLKHLENLAGAWGALAKAGLGRNYGIKILSR